MKPRNSSKSRVLVLLVVAAVFLFLFTFIGVSWSKVSAQAPTPGETISPYLTIINTTASDGTFLTDTIINGPPTPPPGYEAQQAAVTAIPESAKLLTVPAYTWEYGCSAVSGAMIAGYYDRNGYPKMYTGPTAGGVMPLTDSSWPTWSDGNDTYPNNPLIASHQGVDGRTTRGSIDDYWVQYNSTAQDPFITGGWTQHSWGTAIGDYMKTSQSKYNNTDGSTHFYNYTNSATKLTCAAMPGLNISTLDGTYGRKLFYQAKGYTVTDCYNQKTDNNVSGGFSMANFRAQIDAGHPVLLNLAGHSIVGVGYASSSSNTIYVHDTWDTSNHAMTWGGSYSGMNLLSVSIVNLAGGAPVTVPTLISPSGTISDTTPTFTWSKVTGATKYQFAVYKGNTFKYSKTVNSSTCGSTTCSNTPATVLSIGAYNWKAQAYVGGAWKSYSSYMSFTVQTAIKTVLVDDAHSNYYSIASGYTTWNNLLKANGFKVTQTTSYITASLLSGQKVYVALLPASYYTTSEKNALYTWVNNGGSLLVIGDFYSYWSGPSSDLSTKYGISTRPVSCATDNTNYDAYNYWIYLYSRNYTAFGSIMNGIGSTETFCTASLTSTSASAVIRLDADAVPSNAVIVMARKVGSGRVMVLGDSNFWSDPSTSDGINSHDNKKFALRAISWLATGTATGSGAFVDVNTNDLILTPPVNLEFDPAMPGK